MDAFDEILNKLPSDIGGSTADNGFTFQKNWALMKLLDLEDSGKSYTIIFDYHDDIQVLDSDEAASNIDFYQIKTSVNYWKVSTLCKKEQDADGNSKMSFLGKLIYHFLQFENTRDVYFVTNNYLSNSVIDLKGKKRSDVMDFTILSEKAQTEIKNKIKDELGEDVPDESYKHLHIIQNQLHLTESTDMLVGKIATFLQRHLGNSEINPKAFYDNLFAEVTKRNDYKEICKTKEEMFLHKAISKKQFLEYIKGLKNFTSFESKCNSVVGELKEGTTLRQRITIKNKLNKELKNEYFQYDNIEFIKLSNIVRAVRESNEMEMDDSLWSYGNRILPEVKLKYQNPLKYDDHFILALIFYIVYE